MLELLRRHGGRLLVSLPVGVGKSTNLDAVVEEAVRSDAYDVVVVLCPTWRIIHERRWVRQQPPGVDVRLLRPRPRKRCGPERDGRWRAFESVGLGLLG